MAANGSGCNNELPIKSLTKEKFMNKDEIKIDRQPLPLAAVSGRQDYRYMLIFQNCSSNKLGNCDICGKSVTEVYHQIEERFYSFKYCNAKYEGWTSDKCNSFMGHENCLILNRIQELS